MAGANGSGNWARWACGIVVTVLMCVLVALASAAWANANGVTECRTRLDAQGGRMSGIEAKLDRLDSKMDTLLLRSSQGASRDAAIVGKASEKGGDS